MKILTQIICILLNLSVSYATENEIAEMSKECKIDSECILFKDGCGFLFSVLKEKLPSDHYSINIKENLIIYTWNYKRDQCEINYFRAPDWPENPGAKCLDKKCTVFSKSISKNSHTKLPEKNSKKEKNLSINKK